MTAKAANPGTVMITITGGASGIGRGVAVSQVCSGPVSRLTTRRFGREQGTVMSPCVRCEIPLEPAPGEISCRPND